MDCRKGYSYCWRKDCSGDDGRERSPKKAFSSKKSTLLQLVEGSLVPKSIIFCNKIETCRKVENILTRFDRSGTRIRVLPFHSALAQGSRLANMEEFTNSNSKEVSQFLVCTDRASRRIDFSVWIMLYSSTSLAIQVCATCRKNSQRCSRNREGIHLCGGETSLPCRKIMERKRKGHPVHDVPAAYELLYQRVFACL